MNEINPTILKTTIEAIPVLNEDNFSSLRTRITALFKLGRLKDQILAAIILAKLSTVTHNNVVTSSKKDDTLAWKAIQKRFISSEPLNRARVYNQFEKVRSTLVKMEDVCIKLAYDVELI
ncbi:hypothetical protein VP01_522g2 [Puccinia sorghi]|uniref:Uncharacterized protein n=1 Tax=Puccinia sorghi TaxID=27349 RepID=A0A0L6UMJ9_9BASI|nr:hypothetical protein VP01_522g2 [Puccinia sorghi]